jgi:hypothetical protein
MEAFAEGDAALSDDAPAWLRPQQFMNPNFDEKAYVDDLKRHVSRRWAPARRSGPSSRP